MANKYPYVASAGPLMKAVERLRKSFPKEVTADTLRKLGVAPKNESYVINVLRFLGVVDEDGAKVEAKASAFIQHKDEAFQEQFGHLVKEAYEELFELHGDDAWTLDRASLAQFFRTTDHSSEIVGTRQAGTFGYLAALAGHAETPKAREASPRKSAMPAASASNAKANKANKAKSELLPVTPAGSDARFGLTVRVEVNLPAEGDQDTYDRIFKSIRKNLIDGQ